jgi:gluconate 2-dehydrogenase
MMKQKVLVTQAIFPETIERLAQYFEVDAASSDRALDRAALAARLADKDGVMIVSGDAIDAAMLDAAPRLRVCANMAVGYNNLDIGAMSARNVLATNTPDVLNETTADLGWTLLMAAARRIFEAERWMRAGHWDSWRYDAFNGVDVYGSTLGIVGMGRIGQAIARRGLGFGMRIVYHNRSRLPESIEQALGATWASKDDLLRQADHVMLVLPYSPLTHHTIGAAELALMKPSATLVNIARGGIVNDAALIDALAARRIAAAGLDVFEGEPRFDRRFLDLPNVALTPHIGSATESTRRAMARLAADNLIAALGEGPDAGQPANPLNREVLGKARA